MPVSFMPLKPLSENDSIVVGSTTYPILKASLRLFNLTIKALNSNLTQPCSALRKGLALLSFMPCKYKRSASSASQQDYSCMTFCSYPITGINIDLRNGSFHYLTKLPAKIGQKALHTIASITASKVHIEMFVGEKGL